MGRSCRRLLQVVRRRLLVVVWRTLNHVSHASYPATRSPTRFHHHALLSGPPNRPHVQQDPLPPKVFLLPHALTAGYRGEREEAQETDLGRRHSFRCRPFLTPLFLVCRLRELTRFAVVGPDDQTTGMEDPPEGERTTRAHFPRIRRARSLRSEREDQE